MVFGTQKVHDPKISKSGSVIMRSSDNEAFLVYADADGTNQRIIAHYPPSNVGGFEGARFSEDGAKVVYESINTEGRWETGFVDLESGESQDLTQICQSLNN